MDADLHQSWDTRALRKVFELAQHTNTLGTNLKWGTYWTGSKWEFVSNNPVLYKAVESLGSSSRSLRAAAASCLTAHNIPVPCITKYRLTAPAKKHFTGLLKTCGRLVDKPAYTDVIGSDGVDALRGMRANLARVCDLLTTHTIGGSDES